MSVEGAAVSYCTFDVTRLDRQLTVRLQFPPDRVPQIDLYCPHVIFSSDNHYQEVQTSPTFFWVQKETLYRSLKDCNEQGETKTKRAFRNWVREQISLLGTNG